MASAFSFLCPSLSLSSMVGTKGSCGGSIPLNKYAIAFWTSAAAWLSGLGYLQLVMRMH